MMLPEICIKRPVFATVLSLIIVLIGLISYTRLSVREYPRIDEPVVSVVGDVPRGVGRSRRVAGHQAARGFAGRHRRRRGDDIAEPLGDVTHQRPLHVETRPRLRRGGRSRQGGAGARQAAGHDRRADHLQGRGGLQSDHLHRGAGRFAVDARSLGLRQALRAAAVVGAPRRGGRAHLRRAPGVHAHQPGPHAAGGLQADGAGRRGRHPQAERRDSGGPHRVDGARVHGGGGDRHAHARAVQQHHHRQRRRLSGAHPRCRIRGDRPGRRAHHLALQRQVVAQHRRHQAGGVESAGTVERGPRRSGQDQPGAAARHEARRRVRHIGVHRPLDQVGVRDDRRGHPARRARHLFLPAQPARDADPAHHDSRVADWHLRDHVCVRLHHQHAVAAGHRAGDRSGGGRRHRHAREHFPPCRGRHAAQGGGHPGCAGNRLRDHRDDADARIGVRAAGICHRAHRPAVHRVRAHAGGRGDGFRVHRADAVADDVLAAAQAPGAAFVDLQHHRGLDQRAHQRLPAGAYRDAACALAGGAGMGGCSGPGRAVLHAAQSRARADRRPRCGVRPRHRAAGLDAFLRGGPDPADRGVLRAGPRGRRVHVDPGLSDGRRRQCDIAAQALGRAQEEAAADHRRDAPQARVDPRRYRLPHQSAVARTVVPLHAGRIRRDVAGALRRVAADRRPLS